MGEQTGLDWIARSTYQHIANSQRKS
jgi:hypothetical protein